MQHNFGLAGSLIFHIIFHHISYSYKYIYANGNAVAERCIFALHFVHPSSDCSHVSLCTHIIIYVLGYIYIFFSFFCVCFVPFVSFVHLFAAVAAVAAAVAFGCRCVVPAIVSCDDAQCKNTLYGSVVPY